MQWLRNEKKTHTHRHKQSFSLLKSEIRFWNFSQSLLLLLLLWLCCCNLFVFSSFFGFPIYKYTLPSAVAVAAFIYYYYSFTVLTHLTYISLYDLYKYFVMLWRGKCNFSVINKTWNNLMFNAPLKCDLVCLFAPSSIRVVLLHKNMWKRNTHKIYAHAYSVFQLIQFMEQLKIKIKSCRFFKVLWLLNRQKLIFRSNSKVLNSKPSICRCLDTFFSEFLHILRQIYAFLRLKQLIRLNLDGESYKPFRIGTLCVLCELSSNHANLYIPHTYPIAFYFIVYFLFVGILHTIQNSDQFQWILNLPEIKCNL